MTEQTGEERRKHIRAPIELKVEYKKLNTFFSDYTKNISKGGTFIKTDRPLPIGTEFLFRLFIPGRDEPFEIQGEVVWLNEEGNISRPDVKEMGMGIRYVYSQESEREEFHHAVGEMMRKSLGEKLYRKLLEKDSEADDQ